MKNRLYKLLLMTIVLSILLALPSLACEGVPMCDVYAMGINMYLPIKVYSDSECTKLIEHTEDLTVGTEYYYQITGIEGVHMETLKSRFDTIDQDSFIFNGEFSMTYDYYIAGDFDFTYSLNILDAIHIVRYVAHHDYDGQYINLRAADFNRDGTVDARDAIEIAKVIVGLEENPYGGLQKNFDISTPITHEPGEYIAIAQNESTWDENVEDYVPCTPEPVEIISSVEEFQQYWEGKTDEIEKVDPYSNPDDEVGAEFYADCCQQVRDAYPLDKDALFAKYDESFFVENNLIIAAQKTAAGPNVEYDGFGKINGVPTVHYISHVSGVLEDPEVYMLKLISVDKDDIPEGTEIDVRTVREYGNC